MFLQYDMDGYVISMFKFSTTHWCGTHCKRINEQITSTNYIMDYSRINICKDFEADFS